MQQIIRFLTVLIFLLLMIACEEEITPPEFSTEFAIQPFDIPARLNIEKPRFYDVAFQVTHPNGPSAIASVILTFLGSDQSTMLQTLELYDDGGQLQSDDRDVIAGDGIFTNQVFSDSAVFPEGEVFIQVLAVDQTQETQQTGLISALAFPNIPPVLVSVDVPDTLFSGVSAVLFSVGAQDSNDVEDIANLEIRVTRGGIVFFSGNLPFLNKTAGDSGQFSQIFDSTFAAGFSGDYTLEFQATDLSEDLSNILSKNIYLENLPPGIFNLGLLDSLELPPVGFVNSTLITVDINDPQGLADIDSVYFNSVKPNGLPSINNPLLMYDNGLPFDGGNPVAVGDEVKGDGTFSSTIGLQSDALTGAFIFSFFVRDKAGQLTTGPVDSLIVYQ